MNSFLHFRQRAAKYFGYMILLILGPPNSAYTQDTYTQDTYSVLFGTDTISVDVNHVSDYSVKIYYDLDLLCAFESFADVKLTSQVSGVGEVITTFRVYPPGGDYPSDYYYFNVGPGYNNYESASAVHYGSCIDHEGWSDYFGVFLSTEPLRPPVNVQATDSVYDDKIIVTWEKGTDVPIEDHDYRVYRNGILIVEISGEAFIPGEDYYEIIDNSPPGGVTVTYAIKTVAYGQESVAASDQGSLLSIGLIASDGLHFNKTKLNWKDISHVATDIRVERSFPEISGREELAILNKNATTFSDIEGIPGFPYTYYVTPISNTQVFMADSDEGYSRPKGKITGHVTSQKGAGVSGVEIYVELIDNIPDGGAPLDPCLTTYCAVTDISGYYEIEDVYYYTGARFVIHPEKGNHEFSPDALTRTLNENTPVQSVVDFTDLNVITVSGRVTYPVGPGSIEPCGVKGVSILINGKDFGLLTNDSGHWSASLDNNGDYSFSAKLNDHVYEHNGETMPTLTINADLSNIDFVNTTLRTIHVKAQGGCGTSLGTSVDILITSPEECFEATYSIDASGELTITDLPPRTYSVSVTNVDNGGNNETNIEDQLDVPIDIDLSKLDTMMTITEGDSLKITPPDTIIVAPGDSIFIPAETMVVHYLDSVETTEKSVRFIYRNPIEVTIDFNAAGADIYDNCPGFIVMDQNQDFSLTINVREMTLNCAIDTGTLVIYDEISDKQAVGQKIPIRNGIANYIVQPGNPDLGDGDHQKYLYIVPKIDFAIAEPATFWVIVTGIKSNTPSFVSTSPEIPQLIIHDPPGDNSFATIEKGTSVTTSSTLGVQYGAEAGVYLNLKAGPKFGVDFLDIEEMGGGQFEFEAKAGVDQDQNTTIETTITFLESFSTSPEESFIGDQGDVYIGSAMNQTYAISQQLNFDPMSCSTNIVEVLEMGSTGFATTFIYTEYHIVNSLLPTLEILKGLETDPVEKNRLQASIDLWNLVLDKNAAARDANAEFRENISISSGADLTRSYESVDGISTSYSWDWFIESSLKVGLFFESESPVSYLEMEGGIMGGFRTTQEEITESSSDSTRTVSYTISDNDIGDFFSIDVLQDLAYDMPAFRINAGTSSCPHEPNTQSRELPEISIYPPIVNNVPPGEVAHFVLDITNSSESGEARQYAVKVVSTSNPEGAIVNVAGSDINNFPVQYYLDPNQQLSLAMTVRKGPLASNYDNIKISIYSECEYELGGDLTEDIAEFSVNFLSECTNVSMHLPYQGWIVNQASNNILHTAFTGYDIDNESFQDITLQMKREGYGYINVATIQATDLIGPFYDYFFDVSGFPDDNYTLRARANCGFDKGYTYSSEVSGIIDRTSLAPFGTPTPSDGFLREGQEVSVTFDKDINCDLADAEISLVREDTDDEITFTTSCSGNKIIFNESLIDQPDLEGVLVTARVHMLQDLNGNVQKYPTQWSFLVNVNPVNWDPEILAASGYEGQSHIIKGLLRNTSLLSKAYSLDPIDGPNIIEYPEWLTPLQPRGTVLPQNDFTIEFAVNPGLLPGLYTGTVTAMVDLLPVSMEVTFELLARPVYWPFDPTQYQYTMNVVAQFSLDNTNINLTTDTRDMVAAFVNGQVRGITNIEYIPELDVYRAFLTIYSNNQGGGGAETVRFRFWHALNGVEYGAVETRTFTLDNTFGTVASPLILHPEGFYQVVPLHKGWTWISLNVATPDMTREHIFQNIVNSSSGNTITIKSLTQTSTFSPQSNWSGNLTTLQLGQGYLVNLSNAPDTLRVVGFPSNTTINVPVVNSWNWIGFPRLTPEPVNDVLENLTPAAGNILKNQSKFSAYDATLHSWIGNLNEFRPGEGYKLFLSSGGTIIFQPSRSDDYQFNPYLYEYNMNVTGFADLSVMGEHDEGELIIGAFIDGECRGTGVLEYVESEREFRTFMLVHGNIADLGKQIEFRIKNDITGTEYFTNGQQLTFIADGLIGTVVDPYLFFGTTTGVVNHEKDGYELKQSRPNPTGGLTSISFTMPQSEHVLLRLYDLNGELVKVIVDAEMNEGDHSIETDLTTLAGGIYYYELRTDNFIGVKKLVKQ